MNKKLCSLLFLFLMGCGTKAPGPVLLIEKARLKEIRKINISPVINTTKANEITPIVENALKDEFSRLTKYTLVNDEPDATVRCTITEYIPFEAKIVESGKEQSVDVSDLTETKANLKEGRGTIWGALVDIFVPSHKIKNKEEYEYKTVSRSPVIGLELTLTISRLLPEGFRDTAGPSGITIYKASKLMSEQSRIPNCYTTTYSNVVPIEQLNSIDFIAGLALKELLIPLK